MGLKLSAGIFTFLVAAPWAFAGASTSCLPDYTSLQATQTLDMAAPGSAEFELKSENASGIFVSKVRMTSSYSPATQQLQLRFFWDGTFGGVSLPYNLFSILILQNGTVAGWYDYTKQCHDLGPGIYPGQTFSPPPLKLEGGSGVQNFQFMVWGRIN